MQLANNHGNWSLYVTLNASSNFREAAILAIQLKSIVSNGDLKKGSEVLVFTDNMSAERTYYKGSSTSLHLHQLVLELRKFQMEGLLKIHYVWFSGKIMIWQGTDGLSRGDLTSGVMAGEEFLKFIPLDESVFQRDNTTVFVAWRMESGHQRGLVPSLQRTRSWMDIGAAASVGSNRSRVDV